MHKHTHTGIFLRKIPEVLSTFRDTRMCIKYYISECPGVLVFSCIPMLRAQIFTEQSAEPLKINLSLSDKDSDRAGDRANICKWE